MNILFVHDAFPGQFIHLFRHLHGEGKHRLMAASRQGSVAKLPCKQFVYGLFDPAQSKKWAIGNASRNYELGISLARQLVALAGTEEEPDVIITHASAAAALFLKDIFPKARFVSFCEWYYQRPKLTKDQNLKLSSLIKSTHNTLLSNHAIEQNLLQSDAAYAPTAFQKEQLPALLQRQVSEIHDGIDTALYKPNPDAMLQVGDKRFSAKDEIITYAARGMEPTRGFPQFMRTLETVLRERPAAQVIIAAEDRICYGDRKEEGMKKWALDTLQLDWDRVHFVGLLPEKDFVKMLQISSLHVYLTMPFVLSWSMLNAMAVGTTVLASDSAPVREVIEDGKNGFLVPMEDVQVIAERMVTLLAQDQNDLTNVRIAARRTVLNTYSLEDCITRQLALMGLD